MLNQNQYGKIIFLIGARGSGKTTIGHELATMLNCPFMDLDAFICERAQKSVAELVTAEGWPAFRALEGACLHEAAQALENGGILATGGGTVLSEENRHFMRDNGHVVWLNTTAEVLAARLMQNPLSEQRPRLTGLEPLEEIRQILQERETLYRACAHAIVNGEADPAALCGQILQNLDQMKQ